MTTVCHIHQPQMRKSKIIVFRSRGAILENKELDTLRGISKHVTVLELCRKMF